MKLENDQYELFEELAELFRGKTIRLLKTILSNTSLSDDEKRAICSEFMAEFCVNLDQGEWVHRNEYYRPVLAFIHGDNLQFWDDNTTLLAPYEAYQHHDKVWAESDDQYDGA